MIGVPIQKWVQFSFNFSCLCINACGKRVNSSSNRTFTNVKQKLKQKLKPKMNEVVSMVLLKTLDKESHLGAGGKLWKICCRILENYAMMEEQLALYLM